MERCRLMSLHGISKDAWKRYTAEGNWSYEIVAPGYKYNMSDIIAAVGLAQLQKVERMRTRREEIASRYTEAFADDPAIEIPTVRPYVRHAWHLYQIAVNPKASRLDRGALARALRIDEIGTSVHFKPLHLFPYYQERLGVRPGQFPDAERCFEETLSLPIYPDLTDADVGRVAQRIRFHLTGKD